MKQKDELYAKPDFGEEDGVIAAELESEFADLDGWEGHNSWRCENDGIVFSCRANIREFLFFRYVDVQVGLAFVFTENHSFVDFGVLFDEHRTSSL